MRNILVDTHIFLWMQFAPKHLSDEVEILLKQDDVRWHLSQISLWEMQIKYDLGKLKLPNAPSDIMPDLITQSGFAYQALQDDAIFMLGKLPHIHRDPFDRLLIATSIINGWEIATVDKQIEAYPVRIVN